MLVLSREVGEGIVISQSIKITVQEVRGRTVSLAIEAPRDVPVVREELIDESSK